MAQNRDTLAPLDHVESGAVLDREAEDGTQWFRLVTPAIDQHGTIIRPEGVRTERFAANPVFLWMHQSGGGFSAPSPDVVIGRVVKWEQSDEAFDILVEFDTSQLATECLRKVRAKLIRMVSIGFRAIKRVDQEIDGRTVPVYEEVELLEASLVIIGSNPEAMALQRAFVAVETGAQIADGDREVLRRLVGDGGPGESAPAVAPPVVLPEVPELPIAQSVPTYLPPTEARGTVMVGTADPSAFTNVATSKGKKSMPMSPEYRYSLRRALSHALEGAEVHTYAAEAEGVPDDHKPMHRSMAVDALKRASGLVKAYRSGHEEPDGDEGGMIRTAPTTKDADIAAQWASVLTESRGLSLRTVGQVVRDTLGTEDAETIEAKIEALKVRSERYDAQRKQERSDSKARENAERERLIADLLTRGIITPALANKARGINPATGQADPGIEAWSIAKIERFAAEAGEPVVQITRVAPLTTETGTVPGIAQQAAPPVGNEAEVPEAVLTLGRSLGLADDAIRTAHAKQIAQFKR